MSPHSRGLRRSVLYSSHVLAFAAALAPAAWVTNRFLQESAQTQVIQNARIMMDVKPVEIDELLQAIGDAVISRAG